MQYFLSTRQDVNTSAIELGQVKRLRIFDSLGVDSKIIELEKNDFSAETQNKLKIQGKVINIFHYFQGLDNIEKLDTNLVLKNILEKDNLIRKGNIAYSRDKPVINAHLYENRIYYVDYLDQYGFTVKREFFVNNHLDYTEYFDDQAHLMMRVFSNKENIPIIYEYFCVSNENQPLLTMIELRKSATESIRFNNNSDFQAYFLDEIARRDDQAVFYCDRSSEILPAFEKMKYRLPIYVMLHSALTPSGNINDEIYSVYKPITKLYEEGKIKGVISSTQEEAKDVKRALEVENSYAIPVTSIEEVAKVPFTSRVPGKIIAVARVDAIKQLDHLFNAVIQLHKKYPELDLSIYGNVTDQKENKKLKQIVADNQAENFIHFVGFVQNLDEAYNSAQLEVLTSKSEGFAMAILEAQAHGCLVVSYDINYGPADIIKNNYSGRLILANDQEKLKNTIEELMTNPKLLASYSEGAYENSKRFDMDHLRNRWLEFLKTEKLV